MLCAIFSHVPPRRSEHMSTEQTEFEVKVRALKLGKLALSCKATKCSDPGIRELGVSIIHEASSISNDGSTRPGRMPPQEQVSISQDAEVRKVS